MLHDFVISGHCARWLNENEEIIKLTGGTVFRVCHNGIQNNKKYEFKYFLPEGEKNFYDTVYSGEIESNGIVRGNLYLYKLGMDETTNVDYVEIIKGESNFDGILVLCVKIKWYFKNYTGNSDSDWINKEEKVKKIRDFHKVIDRRLNKEIWFEHQDMRKDLSKIYLYFVPHHQFENNGIGGEDSTVTVRKNGYGNVKAEEVFNGKNIEIPVNMNAFKLLRYMLGL